MAGKRAVYSHRWANQTVLPSRDVFAGNTAFGGIAWILIKTKMSV